MKMKKIYLLLGLLGMLLVVSPVYAYELIVTKVSEPYEIVPLVSFPEEQQVYLGELENFPIMYEVESDQDFTLTLQLSQVYKNGIDPTLFSLMVVRKDDRGGGVTEVARMNTVFEDWFMRKERAYGMTFQDSPVIEQTVGPGTYRIEVSTPENLGKYQLTIGTEAEKLGYLFSEIAIVLSTTGNQSSQRHWFFEPMSLFIEYKSSSSF
jgi:hypothetical protein